MKPEQEQKIKPEHKMNPEKIELKQKIKPEEEPNKIKRFLLKSKLYWSENKRYALRYIYNRIESFFLNMIGYYKKIKVKREKKHKELLKLNKDITLEINYGKGIRSKIILPVQDKGLSLDLISNGIREPLHVRLMHKLLKPGMTVIDIGANLGYYILMEAKIVKKVYGIEPNPQAFKYLEKSVKLNNLNNTELFNMAVGDKKAVLPFHISESWNLSRLCHQEGSKDEDIKKEIMVKVDTLDNLFKDKEINLVRMDVEGYEMNIIKGMQKIIEKNPGFIIIMEFHSNHFSNKERKEFVNFLRSLNFKIKYLGNPYSNKVQENVPLNKILSIFAIYYLVLEKRGRKYGKSRK